MEKEEYYSNLLESSENETVEFKASYDKEAILKSVGAMANRDGGIIMIGVTNDRRVKGYRSNEVLKKIADDINNALEPALNISVKEILLKGKKVIVVEVPPAPIKPVSVRGRYYIRVGSTNRLMSISEICDMYSLSTSHSWDVQITQLADLRAIDLKKTKNYMKLVENRRGVILKDPPTDFLKKKLFLRNGGVTNAAILLFGREPQEYFPSRIVQIVFYKGSKVNIEFQEEIDGTIFEMIEGSYREVLKILSTKLEIVGTTNVQEYAIPEKALREGIVNALVHRDWSIPSPVYIEISPKGVVITNPGTIPPPLTPEILKEADHYSILRNPKLSESLYEAGYIERYGSGTVRIMESYENSNVKPEWWVKAGRTYLFLPLLQVDIETSIVRLLEIREKVTSSDLVKELGISLNTARKYLRTLVDKGLLEMKGKTRGRYYTLKKG